MRRAEHHRGTEKDEGMFSSEPIEDLSEDMNKRKDDGDKIVPQESITR